MDIKALRTFFEIGETMPGFLGSEAEAIAELELRAPGQAFCLVDDWTVVEIQATPAETASLSARNELPSAVFSKRVILDSRGRFTPEGSVKSSFLTTPVNGGLAITKNTIYVLMGTGRRATASKEVFFFLR